MTPVERRLREIVHDYEEIDDDAINLGREAIALMNAPDCEIGGASWRKKRTALLARCGGREGT